MNHRALRFLAVTCLSLVAFAVAGPAGAGTAERLPADAQVLGAFQLDVLRRSGLFDLGSIATENLGEDARRAQDWLKAAGLDLARDVDEIAFAVSNGKPGGAAAKDGAFALVASGRFDPARVRAALVAKGGEAVRLPGAAGAGSIATVRLPGPQGATDSVHVSFVDSLLVVGNEEGVRRTHARAGAGSALLAKARGLVPSDAAFWIVADPSMDASSLGTAVPVAGLRGIALWATAKDVLDVRAVAEAASAEAATQLAGTLQVAAGLATMGASSADASAAGLLQALSGLRITASGSSVDARLTLTKDQIAAARARSGSATAR